MVHAVSGKLTVNGFSFQTLLPAGTYEVRIDTAYSGRTAGPRIASGSMKVASPVSVTGPISNLVWNQVVHPVSGRLTVNGATPTLKSGTCTSDLTVAKISVSNSNVFSGSVDVPCTADFSFSLLLPPGTYDVRVAGTNLGAGVNFSHGPAQAVAKLRVP